MAEDTGVVVEGEVLDDSSEQEKAEARKMGWADKDKWKGDLGKWETAKQYIERGRQVLPILNATNARLREQLTTLEQRDAAREEELRAMKAALDTINTERKEEAQESREDQIAEVKRQIQEASRDGDHAKVADLTDQLVELRLQKEPERPAAGSATVDAAELQRRAVQESETWLRENPEFLSDEKRSRALHGEILRLRGAGFKGAGRSLFDEAKRGVVEMFGEYEEPGHQSRVAAGDGGNGRRAGANGGEKGYAELPPAAKEAAKRMVPRLVGEGKAYKSEADWNKHYARTYWSNVDRHAR